MQHTLCEQKATAYPGSPIWNFAGKIATMASNLMRCMRRRKHLATLGQMSPAQLADIGLRRDDIYESAALGLDEDVTCHLANIARQRRLLVNRSI
jgi:uncharacterized protein YjiS (DUF1127 family)